MTDLGSAPVPPPGPDDHARGPRPLVVVYTDFECPRCALLHERLTEADAAYVVRHFPVKSKHPRARAAAHAAEAAGRQGQFWPMHDALFADQGRLEDPHLWDRAARLGLDADRFERDRRSEDVAARVSADFTAGLRAGVVATPTLFAPGIVEAGVPTPERLEILLRQADETGWDTSLGRAPLLD